MLTRRAFLRTPARRRGGARCHCLQRRQLDTRVRRGQRSRITTPQRSPANEDYWREIQQAFTLDRTIVNLNNGGVCPSPRVVHEAFKRYLDLSNQAPAYHMWQILEPNIETVRRRLAAAFGCDRRGARDHAQRERGAADRPARRRRSSAGDEVVTTNQDYGRMLDTWEQRVRRDGIRLTKISFPVPPRSLDDLADRLLGALTPATKVLHFCHITNLTGQIFPVRRICDEARRRGVKTIVDGAHAFAHFPFKAADLGCDFYGTSLHKWLLAPIGTGFLYVRREEIPGLWPLTPARGNQERRHPQVRGDRDPPGGEPQRDCRSAGVPRRDRRRAEGRAAALPARPVGDAARGAIPRCGFTPTSIPAHSCAIGTVQITDVPTRQLDRAAVDRLAHHRHADRARRIRRREDHAERLHDDRGDRHVRVRDGADRRERAPVGIAMLLAQK